MHFLPLSTFQVGSADDVEINALIAPSLSENDSSVELLAAAKADIKDQQTKRKKEQETAKERLAARRAVLAKKQREQLQATGIDPTTAAKIIAEREELEIAAVS
eukprot:SAG31_NODE_22078_length_534_cov_1.172414_2_plen_103_part_01